MQVSGWAGSFEQGRMDIAIAMDVSRSTRNATLSISDGARVRVDGSLGSVEILG